MQIPKTREIKVVLSKHCNRSQFKNITTHKAKTANVQNINTSKSLNLQKTQIIPLSSLKRLLAHLSSHLLPDNESSDHRHAHTDRVSYAY